MSEEWRPIDSAPRDGTNIILCGDPKRYGKPIAIGYWADYGGFQCWTSFGPDGSVVAWMPLPTPPRTAA